MDEKSMEHQILVELMARKIEEYLREVIRDHGDIFKSMGLNVKEVGLFGLDIIEEATATLKTKAQQAEKRQ